MVASGSLRSIQRVATTRGTGPASAERQFRHRRDAGLERARSLTKTIGVASVAAVAVFGIYLSRALPGHPSTPAGSSVTSGAAAGVGSSTGQSATNLAPPNAPPAQTQQQAPVVSGSS